MDWHRIWPAGAAGHRLALAGVLGLALLGAAGADAVARADTEIGESRDHQLQAQSVREFGVVHPLEASSPAQIGKAEAEADPTKLASLAGGLRARVVTRVTAPDGVAAPNLDMLALWPNDVSPTHLIACNEQGPDQPGLQRINLQTGAAETILTGTSDCDPVRRTPWGTILFAEEAGGGPSGGRVYELLNPLGTTGVTLNRATGAFSGGTGAANFAVRPALGRLSFEGFAVYASGLVYFGDENRPSAGTAGGAYFKFVPAMPRSANAPITALEQSPLVAGSIYGLRVGKRSGNTDYGQGTQFGFGTWVPIPAAPDPDLRAQAAALKLTGYYRPEDIDIDREEEAAGRLRFCGNNTGNESDDQFYGETICLTDGTLAEALANSAPPEIQEFVAGNPALAMPDNIAYQPGHGNWILHEDADTRYLSAHNDDLWDCLPDGQDDDLLSDGCVRIGTLNDLDAEWTGGIFDASGTRFFVSVQHNVTGKGVILEITGWRR
jgi:secreted PhoX family phosphatase